MLSDHIALFARWYYRSSARTTGEMVFANGEGAVPHKPLLRAISRVAARAASAEPAVLDQAPIQWHP
jgi:excinuclease ABC subunit C